MGEGGGCKKREAVRAGKRKGDEREKGKRE